MGTMRRNESASVDHQVEDLRERMRMLQGDRKANIDILEANKAANRDEIKRLREENKGLRLNLSQMQRVGSEGTDEAAEAASLQREVSTVQLLVRDASIWVLHRLHGNS